MRIPPPQSDLRIHCPSNGRLGRLDQPSASLHRVQHGNGAVAGLEHPTDDLGELGRQVRDREEQALVDRGQTRPQTPVDEDFFIGRWILSQP